MKRSKQIILMIIMIILSSCTWRNAQSAFDSGRYLDSVSLTMSYLSGKNFGSLKPEDQKVVIDRLNYIENVYQAKIKQDTERQYIELLDYWKMLYMIEKNPTVVQALDQNITKTSNPYVYLKEGIDKINNFSGYTQREVLRNVINSLRPTTAFIKSNVYDSGYIILISEYYKAIANIYNRLGQLEEQAKNYEGAKQAYYNSYEIYKTYSANYNNNYDNYVRIDKQLVSEKAKNAIKRANDFVANRDYVKAVPSYKEALSLYNKYPNDFKSQINDLKYNLSRAEENVKYQLAEEAYKKASDIILRATTKADYEKAIALFKEASKYVYDYKDSAQLANKYTKLIQETEQNPFKGNGQTQQQPIQSTIETIYPKEPVSIPISQQPEIPNYQVGEVRRDNTEIKNYLAITMMNNNQSPYDASYKETIKYDKTVSLVNGKSPVGTEYIVTESITVSPVIRFKNGHVAFDTYKFENRYKEYVYSNGLKRIIGNAYGPDKMLDMNKDQINSKIKNLIKLNIK